MAIVTMTQALKKLYKAVVGEDTTKNNPTKIVSELADNWSGGGGSSDLSTAVMTMVNESGIGAKMYGAFADTNPQHTMKSYGLANTGSNEFTVLMYSNQAEVSIKDGYLYNIVCTGDATADDSGVITITGDCTITLTALE